VPSCDGVLSVVCVVALVETIPFRIVEKLVLGRDIEEWDLVLLPFL
jgi:hypothetical protein